jgi:hypothetical protein
VIVDPAENRCQDEQLPRFKPQVRGFPSPANVREPLDEEADLFCARDVEPIREVPRLGRGEFV